MSLAIAPELFDDGERVLGTGEACVLLQVVDFLRVGVHAGSLPVPGVMTP
jgi:hypothetical protein